MLRFRLPGIWSDGMRSEAMTRLPWAVSAAQSRLPTAPAAPMMSVAGAVEELAATGAARTTSRPPSASEVTVRWPSIAARPRLALSVPSISCISRIS